MNGNRAYVSQKVDHLITSNLLYTASVWIKVLTEGNSWGASGICGSQWRQMEGKLIGCANAVDSVIMGWQYIEYQREYTPAELATDLYIGIVNYGMPGTVVSDNLIFGQNSTPTPASTATPSPGPDLFNNGNFETGALGDYNQSGASVITSPALNSVYAVKLTEKNAYISQNIGASLSAGVEYNISVWVKVIKEGGSWGAPSLICSEWTDLNTFTYGMSASMDNLAAGWQLIQFTKTFSAGELSGNVYAGVRNFGMLGDVSIDDFKITQKY